jgi:hypothetical protein
MKEIFQTKNYYEEQVSKSFLDQISVDAGPIGFPGDMTISHGPWPGPQMKARRGAMSATPNPSRIGHTSQIPMESNFYI